LTINADFITHHILPKLGQRTATTAAAAASPGTSGGVLVLMVVVVTRSRRRIEVVMVGVMWVLSPSPGIF
jgi:hypothetical protein